MPTTKAPGHRKMWTYTDDLGHAWRVGVKAIYFPYPRPGTIFGGTPATATVPRLPKGIRPREVRCKAPGFDDIWVKCYNKACIAWTAGPSNFVWFVRGQDLTCTTTWEHRPERRPKAGVRA